MNNTHFSLDIQEFLTLLLKHKVRYVIVGGEAVIFYGYARLTGDVDFFYESKDENIEKLYETLSEFWDGDIPGIEKKEELKEPGVIVQFGTPPNRIDLLNQIDGVTFQEAWDNKIEVNIKIRGEKIPTYFIGLNQLIKNKELLKRYKDLEDLKYLKKAKKKKD